jgi:DNA-binding CsgD family transcriptional regulator
MPRPKSILAQRFAGGNGLSIVLLADLKYRAEPNAVTLQQCFRLTPCEARLAGALATGVRLTEIAQRYGVEVGTIRAQLKSVFLKTGTRRQSELVSLLARLPPFFLINADKHNRTRYPSPSALRAPRRKIVSPAYPK